jgi:hypothetical protein
MTADDPMAWAAHKKRVCKEKKKKCQEGKKAEEARPKAKKETTAAHAIAATISPLLADMGIHDTNYNSGLEDLNLNNDLFPMMFAELIVYGEKT